MIALREAAAMLTHVQPMRVRGTVAAARGLTLLVEDFPAPVGTLVSIRPAGGGGVTTFGEVIGFTKEQSVVMPLQQTGGVRRGDLVVAEQASPVVSVGRCMLGRVVDGLGRPIDDSPRPRAGSARPLNPEPLKALRRRRVTEPLLTGVRAVDLFTTLGKGQRMGIFAGPGVGKSTLLGTIAQRTSADVNVIALIGERGREVRDFIEHGLGTEGLARSVVVVATGDESALMRIRAAKLACAAAEQLRDEGLDVLLMMDSVTRFAHAQRQVGLAVGEPPTTKGYTPSVFAQLALLLERAGSVRAEGGSGKGGSITGLYTILVEGDDMTEPVADAARGILDGHLILSRRLAQKAHYPAIDVLDSVSRVADDVTNPEHAEARRWLLRLLAAYRDVEDLVQIGAYAKGANPDADTAIRFIGAINDVLRQGKEKSEAFVTSLAGLVRLAAESKAFHQKLVAAKAAQKA